MKREGSTEEGIKKGRDRRRERRKKLLLASSAQVFIPQIIHWIYTNIL